MLQSEKLMSLKSIFIKEESGEYEERSAAVKRLIGVQRLKKKSLCRHLMKQNYLSGTNESVLRNLKK